MKTLLLVRHAKSDWGSGEFSDFERPLNNRGLHDAPFMAKIIHDKNIIPELIISSPAARALTTAKLFAVEFNYPIESIMKNNTIYNGSTKQLFDIINQTDDAVNTLMFFGHNPDITNLCCLLSGNIFDNIPTTGVVCIDFDITKWRQANNNNGKMRFFEYPKKFGK